MRVKYLMKKESNLSLNMEKTLAIVSRRSTKTWGEGILHFFFLKVIDLFIGCTGSLLLLAGFL